MADGSIGRAIAEAGDSVQGAFDHLARYSPRKDTLVSITAGKHKGKIGRVFWHGVDMYGQSAFRYGSDIQISLREAAGRYGFRIGVKLESGEKFFTKADYAMVCID